MITGAGGYDPRVINGALGRLGAQPIQGVPNPQAGMAAANWKNSIASQAPIGSGVPPPQQQSAGGGGMGGMGGMAVNGAMGVVDSAPKYAKPAGPNPYLAQVYARQHAEAQQRDAKKKAVAMAVLNFYTGGAASAAGGAAGGGGGGGMLGGILGGGGGG
jgi:hypothetical protein